MKDDLFDAGSEAEGVGSSFPVADGELSSLLENSL